ncbi:hypothetical protein TraAM80_08918 [Trypanosoma rangeli]|uniref:Uncharacterized protein n=1 Tax=Trypanosoma rangeli TaxID=5698 RepID=A0A422MYG2_TRYRA|nr:uncharacterized protein TraAM80_08918 [Trypanosoma rangeli]RNE98210.1 hypothetical protein TraAM80_08918 [Trypanosoma rangeli]|eukprot:RNE98210.1 hypothetical protein TraAM80_08918 [Trypanosoma rangeli]
MNNGGDASPQAPENLPPRSVVQPSTHEGRQSQGEDDDMSVGEREGLRPLEGEDNVIDDDVDDGAELPYEGHGLSKAVDDNEEEEEEEEPRDGAADGHGDGEAEDAAPGAAVGSGSSPAANTVTPSRLLRRTPVTLLRLPQFRCPLKPMGKCHREPTARRLMTMPHMNLSRPHHPTTQQRFMAISSPI